MTIRCVLMDIDGTIVSVAFARDWLFPYAQRRIAFFLREQRENTVAQEWGARPAYQDLPGILTHEDLPGCPTRKSGEEWQPVA